MSKWQPKTRGGWPVENVQPIILGVWRWQGQITHPDGSKGTLTWTEEGYHVSHRRPSDGDLIPLEAPVEAPADPDARKIPKPKTYRAFANKAEYAPHRDRWVVCKDQAGNGDFSSCLPTSFDDDGVVIGGDFEEYGEAFRGFGFDNFDGTTEPFGVEVQS